MIFPLSLDPLSKLSLGASLRLCQWRCYARACNMYRSLEIKWTLHPVFFPCPLLIITFTRWLGHLCLEFRGILDSVSRTSFLLGPSYSLYLTMTSTLRIMAISALWQQQICGAQHFSSLLFLLSVMHWVNVLGWEHQRFVSRLTGLCTLITQGQSTWTALGASIVHLKHSWVHCVFQVSSTVWFQFLPPLLCSLFF